MGELNQELPLAIGDSPLNDFAADMSHLRIDAQNHQPCSVCGCNGSSTSPRPVATANPAVASASPTAHCAAKRASPEPQSEPNPKNFFGENLSVFSKIPLPITEPFPPLRRCISDPCTPPRAAFAPQLPDSAIVHTPTEDRRILAGSPSLPPKPPALRRSVSDPSPSPARSLSRANEESPSAKRLKRMQDRLKEMNHWMEEIVYEVDERVGTEEVPGPADQGAGEAEDQSHESVSVDKVGDCIKIRFKCPCKRGFKFLLFGGDVYYRLV